MDHDYSKRKLTAILSTDVVGYSRLMEKDEENTIKNLEESKRLIAGLVKVYHGRVVDAPGDNLLAEFSSVICAVECAVKIQKEINVKNSGLSEDRKMEFRIGVNLGDVVEENGRIYGNGVNIAARLECLASPGGICISRTAFDQVNSKLDLGYEYLGEHNVKNITVPVRVYRVLTEPENAGRVIGEKRIQRRQLSLNMTIPVLMIFILAAAATGFYLYYHQPAHRMVQTIAVLPFDDLSTEKDQKYFVDGLSEEIINSLCQIPDLGVAGRTSSFSFKGSKKTTHEIADSLGVENILEIGARESENMFRITAQLIRAADDLLLWSETYDRESKDIFAIQKEIAKAVAEELKLPFKFEKSSKQLGGTDNEKAQEYYITAKALVGLGSSDDFKSTNLEEDLIESAISIDPEFALAWVRKAAVHSYYGLIKPAKYAGAERDEALKAVQRAIELEPDLALAYHYLGSIKTGGGDFTGGEISIQRAFELRPAPFPDCSITAFYHYGPVGYLNRAFEIIKKSRVKDPFSPNCRQFYIASLALLGDRQQAETEYKLIRKSVGENQKDNMFLSLVRLGTKDKLFSHDIIYSDPVFNVAKEYLHSPRKGLSELQRLLTSDDLNFFNLYFMAMWAAYFGDPEFAINIMEKGVKVNASAMSVSWWPVMKEVRQLPEFKKFVRQIGLVDYWKKYGWPDLCQPAGNDDFFCE